VRRPGRVIFAPALLPPFPHGQPLVPLLLSPGGFTPFFRQGGNRCASGCRCRGSGAANPRLRCLPIRQRSGAGHHPRFCGGGGAHGGLDPQSPSCRSSFCLRTRRHHPGGDCYSRGQDCDGEGSAPSCGEGQSRSRCPQGSNGQQQCCQPFRRLPVRPERSCNPLPGKQLRSLHRSGCPPWWWCSHTPFQFIHPFLPHG
jgi:hypothetical protein